MPQNVDVKLDVSNDEEEVATPTISTAPVRSRRLDAHAAKERITSYCTDMNADDSGIVLSP